MRKNENVQLLETFISKCERDLTENELSDDYISLLRSALDQISNDLNQNTIYIVIGKFSSWDSYHERNLKSFKRKEDAEKYVDKANRVLTKFSSHIATSYNMEQSIKDSIKTEKDMETYHERIKELYNSDKFKWAEKLEMCHSRLEEFNECYIQELELK